MPITYGNRVLKSQAAKALKALPYYSSTGTALLEIGGQLAETSDPNQASLANAILKGVVTGLGEEAASGQKHPVCPFCGKRHA